MQKIKPFTEGLESGLELPQQTQWMYYYYKHTLVCSTLETKGESKHICTF